jgi:EmrB/QacA subfamily drug resistance transporter
MSKTTEGPSRTWVLALTATASFMVALDALVVTTVLSTIQRDLAAPIETLEWIVNAYNLTFAVLLLTGAALGDRFGRRRVFALGLTLFMVASAACALSRDAAALIAARALQGAGAALVMPLAMALLSAAYPREQRAKALGHFAGITGLALIAGPVAGGVIAAGFDWRFIFWLNLPVGLITLAVLRSRVAESRGPDEALDLKGLVLVSGAAFALIWGLMLAAGSGWTSLEALGALSAGVLLTVTFVAFERRTEGPMVPMRLFGLRGFSAGSAAAFALYASMYGVVFFLPQFLQIAQGHDPLGAGLRLLPWTATLLVFAPIGGALVNKVGERALIAGGLTLQAVGFGVIALVATPALPYGWLAAPLVLAGAGVSMAMPAVQNAVLGAVAPAEIGKASGTFNMLRYLAGAFGIALLSAAFGAAGSLTSTAATSSGFAAAIGVAALLSLAGAAAGLCLPGQRSAAALPAEA